MRANSWTGIHCSEKGALMEVNFLLSICYRSAESAHRVIRLITNQVASECHRELTQDKRTWGGTKKNMCALDTSTISRLQLSVLQTVKRAFGVLLTRATRMALQRGSYCVRRALHLLKSRHELMQCAYSWWVWWVMSLMRVMTDRSSASF